MGPEIGHEREENFLYDKIIKATPTDCFARKLPSPCASCSQLSSFTHIFASFQLLSVLSELLLESSFSHRYSPPPTFNMVASSTTNNLEREDHKRDAAFNKAMHGNSAQARGGIAAMFSKGAAAKQAAVDEYFKHWDDKDAKDETEETRAASAFRRRHFRWRSTDIG